MNILLLVGGLLLILLGANGLTDGAASVAKRFHTSDFCQIAFCDGVFDRAVEAFLIDDAKSLCRQVQNNPRIFFNPVELLCEEVDIETTLCATLGVRHIVAYHRFFAGDLTNF